MSMNSITAAGGQWVKRRWPMIDHMKSRTTTAKLVLTTARVVAQPTPSEPPVAVRPALPAMTGMAKP
jgi:hypothetical protein